MSDELLRVRGIGPVVLERLRDAGIKSIGQLADSKVQDLVWIKGFGKITAKKVIENAKYLMNLERGLTIVLDSIKNNFAKQCPKCGGTLEKRFIVVSPTRRINALQCKVCKFYLPQ